MMDNEFTVEYASEQISAAAGYMPGLKFKEGSIVYMCQDTSNGKDAARATILLLRYHSVLKANIRNVQGA